MDERDHTIDEDALIVHVIDLEKWPQLPPNCDGTLTLLQAVKMGICKYEECRLLFKGLDLKRRMERLENSASAAAMSSLERRASEAKHAMYAAATYAAAAKAKSEQTAAAAGQASSSSRPRAAMRASSVPSFIALPYPKKPKKQVLNDEERVRCKRILVYIRQEWGQREPPVSPSSDARVWTLSEIDGRLEANHYKSTQQFENDMTRALRRFPQDVAEAAVEDFRQVSIFGVESLEMRRELQQDLAKYSESFDEGLQSELLPILQKYAVLDSDGIAIDVCGENGGKPWDDADVLSAREKIASAVAKLKPDTSDDFSDDDAESD